MLRYVEHDVGRSQAAARCCRAAAAVLRGRATHLAADIATADWWGGDREAALRLAEELADACRRDALLLDEVADDLEHESARAVVENRRITRLRATCVPEHPAAMFGHPTAGVGQ